MQNDKSECGRKKKFFRVETKLLSAAKCSDVWPVVVFSFTDLQMTFKIFYLTLLNPGKWPLHREMILFLILLSA
jgi:hypothetical protein